MDSDTILANLEQGEIIPDELRRIFHLRGDWLTIFVKRFRYVERGEQRRDADEYLRRDEGISVVRVRWL